MIGVLFAADRRSRTFSLAEVSLLLDALGEWMSQPYYYTVYGRQQVRRTGARHASISPYGPYSADGGQVFLGLQNNREWAVLCERVLGRPDLITDERFRTNTDRVANDSELTRIIETAIGSMAPDEVVALLDEAGIANARLRTPAEYAAHPQLAARNRWRQVDTPAGPVRALLPPVSMHGREAAMGAVLALGAHCLRARRIRSRPGHHRRAGGPRTVVANEPGINRLRKVMAAAVATCGSVRPSHEPSI